MGDFRKWGLIAGLMGLGMVLSVDVRSQNRTPEEGPPTVRLVALDAVEQAPLHFQLPQEDMPNGVITPGQLLIRLEATNPSPHSIVAFWVGGFVFSRPSGRPKGVFVVRREGLLRPHSREVIGISVPIRSSPTGALIGTGLGSQCPSLPGLRAAPSGPLQGALAIRPGDWVVVMPYMASMIPGAGVSGITGRYIWQARTESLPRMSPDGWQEMRIEGRYLDEAQLWLPETPQANAPCVYCEQYSQMICSMCCPDYPRIRCCCVASFSCNCFTGECSGTCRECP